MYTQRWENLQYCPQASLMPITASLGFASPRIHKAEVTRCLDRNHGTPETKRTLFATHTLVYQSCPGLFLPQLPFDVFHAYTLFGAKVFEPRHSVVIFVLEETAVEFLQRMTYPMGHACCRLHSLLDPPKKYNMCIYPQNDQIILKPVLQTSHSFFKRFDSRHGCNASFNHQDTC